MINLKRLHEKRTWSMLSIGDCYSDSIFLDSGAFGLYNEHVLKRGVKAEIGAHGKELEKQHVVFATGDYSWYSLKPGSEFRSYCDQYAALIKKCKDTDVIFANVDAIANPELTWKIQQYFEQEHGVSPVPIVHYGSTLEQLERYLSNGKRTLIGMGGLGHGTPAHMYIRWADGIFRHICPASNGYKPVVRVHGFAMTSWKLMCRWPWWSVDSATWVKLAAFGWVLTPHWNAKMGRWRYDKAPLQVNMSRKPTKHMAKSKEREHVRTPREARNRHIDNCVKSIAETMYRWLEYVGMPLGHFDADGNIAERGVCTDCNARAMVNLYYMKYFEESRPEWPYPLDPAIVRSTTSTYFLGLGIPRSQRTV